MIISTVGICSCVPLNPLILKLHNYLLAVVLHCANINLRAGEILD